MMNFEERTSGGSDTNHSKENKPVKSDDTLQVRVNHHLNSLSGSEFDDAVDSESEDADVGVREDSQDEADLMRELADKKENDAGDGNSSGKQGRPSPKNDPISRYSLTFMDKVAFDIAEKLQNGARTSDKETVNMAVINLLTTVMAINSLPRYSTGLTVKGQFWRFDEFRMSSCFANLIVADSFLINDDVYAYDVKKRDSYKMTIGEQLTPSETLFASKLINKLCRVNLDIVQVNRADVSLLTECYNNQVINKRMVSRGQTRFDFLKLNLGDNTAINWKEWVAYYTSQILEMR